MSNFLKFMTLPFIIVLIIYYGNSQDTYQNKEVKCRFLSKLQYIRSKELSNRIDNYLRDKIDVYLARTEVDTIALVLKKNDTNYSFCSNCLDTSNTYIFILANLHCLIIDKCYGDSLDSIINRFQNEKLSGSSWPIRYLEYNPKTLIQTDRLLNYGQIIGAGFEIDRNELRFLKFLKEEIKDTFSICPFYYPTNKDDYLIK